MTRVDFYAGSSDTGRTVFTLAQKAVRAGHRVWVLARDAAHAAEIDARLWADPPGGFLPHCRDGHELAARTPVVVGHDPDAVPHDDILINLRDDTPACFSRFGRLLEVVGSEPAAVQAARERYKFYRDRGYPLQHHDLKSRT
ncbi:MAG: DNA polymerase III subunit chi [Rhodocyclaceae bacterium]|nr:DNA polymerase III subunit chi [Rhodocyclaceae bacterium]